MDIKVLVSPSELCEEKGVFEKTRSFNSWYYETAKISLLCYELPALKHFQEMLQTKQKSQDLVEKNYNQDRRKTLIWYACLIEIVDCHQ